MVESSYKMLNCLNYFIGLSFGSIVTNWISYITTKIHFQHCCLLSTMNGCLLFQYKWKSWKAGKKLLYSNHNSRKSFLCHLHITFVRHHILIWQIKLSFSISFSFICLIFFSFGVYWNRRTIINQLIVFFLALLSKIKIKDWFSGRFLMFSSSFRSSSLCGQEVLSSRTGLKKGKHVQERGN